MKRAIIALAVLLVADAVFIAYFCVLRPDYFFGHSYEDALRATAAAILAGLLLLGVLAVLAVVAVFKGSKARK